MLLVRLLLLVLILNDIIAIDQDQRLDKDLTLHIKEKSIKQRYLKHNKEATSNDDDDGPVFHTLAPTSSNSYTLSPTPHSLDNSTPNPTLEPTANPYAPTRAPTDPPDETNGIIVVSTVFGLFLLGVLYFQYIKPNFISKKKLELTERASASDEPDFGQIYGNPLDVKTTNIDTRQFNEKDPLLPKR